VSFSVFKAFLARVFIGVAFLYCLHNAIFKLQQVVDVRRKETTDLVFNVLLFFKGGFISYCLSFIPAFVFLEIYQM
jgi:hypothetical protein